MTLKNVRYSMNDYSTAAKITSNTVRWFWAELSAHISGICAEKLKAWYPILHCTSPFRCFSDQMFMDCGDLPPISRSFAAGVALFLLLILHWSCLAGWYTHTRPRLVGTCRDKLYIGGTTLYAWTLLSHACRPRFLYSNIRNWPERHCWNGIYFETWTIYTKSRCCGILLKLVYFETDRILLKLLFQNF